MDIMDDFSLYFVIAVVAVILLFLYGCDKKCQKIVGCVDEHSDPPMLPLSPENPRRNGFVSHNTQVKRIGRCLDVIGNDEQETPYPPMPLLAPRQENPPEIGFVHNNTQGPSERRWPVMTKASMEAEQPPYPIAHQRPVPELMIPPGIDFPNAPPVDQPPYPVAPESSESDPPMTPPPSYNEAVGQPFLGPSVTHNSKEYPKQSPYNPHY